MKFLADKFKKHHGRMNASEWKTHQLLEDAQKRDYFTKADLTGVTAWGRYFESSLSYQIFKTSFVRVISYQVAFFY